jgi:hypothetical protein
MTSCKLELLESRRLLSVSIAEAEPNNTSAKANSIPHTLDEHVLVGGKVNAPGDHDWFKIQLNAGDIVGGALAGPGELDPILRLYNNAGKLMMGNDDCFLRGQQYSAPESPLPQASDTRDSEIYYTIKSSGTYFLEISAFEDATAGDYTLDLLVTRPGLEQAPLGQKQILFLDFDGAKVGFLDGTAVDPLVEELPSWGLSAADENTVIDRIIQQVTAKLSTYVAAKGGNSNFGIEIRNSRDHADDFGTNPYVSKVSVGPRRGPGFGADGIAQFIDVGNFSAHDEAVVTVDFMTAALPVIPIQAPLTVYDAIAVGVGDLICHEFGHLLGCFHTDQPSTFEGVPNLMDPDGRQTLGADFIFGTKDDVVRQFGVDSFSRNEPYEGVNDTLTTVAYALSVGKEAPRAGVATAPTTAASLFSTTPLSATRELVATADVPLV